MCNKFFKPTQIGAATALMVITSFVSYAIGLLRDRIIAVNFGTTSLTDTYNASFLIPDILFNFFIAGALMAAFLPIFSEYLIKDKEEAFRIANTILSGAALVISGLAILAFIFTNQIIGFIFHGNSPEIQQNIVNMTRLMLPSAILFAISNTLGNILMSYKHFISYSLSPILYNLGIILGVVFLSDKLSIYSASVGVLIGASLHLIIRIFDVLHTEYKYKFELKVSHPAFKKIIKLMIPKSISLISWQINLYIFAIVGIKLVEGGLAAFNFARNIQSFAVSLFGISFATAVFPHLANAANEQNDKLYTEHIQKTMQRILFFTIPSMIGIMTLSKELVDLILSGGIFNERSIELTSIILFFFAISIPFESLSHILSRALYARQNTITPAIINISTMSIIALISIFVAPVYGVKWFSIGFSMGFIFYIITILIILKKHFVDFDYKGFLLNLGKIIIASGIMSIIILIMKPIGTIIPLKLAHAIRICIGAGMFFGISYLFKIPEITSIKYILDKTFKKKITE